VYHVVTLHSKKLPNKIYSDFEAPAGQHSTYATGWLILSLKPTRSKKFFPLSKNPAML
jgi:hypothetical protein